MLSTLSFLTAVAALVVAVACVGLLAGWTRDYGVARAERRAARLARRRALCRSRRAVTVTGPDRLRIVYVDGLPYGVAGPAGVLP